MSIPRLAAAVLAIAAVPSLAAGQNRSWTPELSVAAGVGHVFRFEDQPFGDRVTAGGDIAIAHKSGWVFDLHADRTFNLRPPLAPCGLVGVSCIGLGHDGPLSITVVSTTVQYRFHTGRIQPYAIGGLGTMWSRSLHSVTQIQGPIARVTESESSDRGFGVELGAGLRMPVGRSWSFNPEVRFLDAPLRSRENLAVTRALIRTTYSRR